MERPRHPSGAPVPAAEPRTHRPGEGERRRDDAFRAVADSAPDAILTADSAGRISYVNPSAVAMFGYAAEELTGQPIAMLVPERLRGRHRDGFRRYVRTRQPVLVGRTVEVPGVRRGGEEFAVELSLSTSGEGDNIVVTAVLRDISDRVRHQRNLTMQLAVTRLLVAGGEVPVTPGAIVARVIENLGWDVGVLWGMDAGQLVFSDLFEADPDRTREFAATCRTQRFAPGSGIPGAVWETGQPLWLQEPAQDQRFARASPALLAGLRTAVALPLVAEGETLGVLELYTSKSEPIDEELRDTLITVASQIGEFLWKRQTQDHLAEARQRFVSTFDNAPIGMAIVSLDGRWLEVNPALTEITGYSTAALREMTFQDITHPDDLDADLAMVERIMAGDISSYSIEKRYVRADGSPVWVQLNVSLVPSDPERPGYVIAQIQDISARREADELRRRHAEELARSNAELERFAHVVAHDLREPLITISGFAALLQARGGEALGGDIRSYVDLIAGSAARGGELLDGVLALARQGAEFSPTLVDCNVLVDEIQATLHQAISRANALIEVGDLPSVRADRMLLGQVFQNLLANALKFGGTDPPHIKVAAKRTPHAWEFAINDNGIGIPEDQQQHIFDMFARGSHTTGGSGIGLAVCCDAVARHGGQMRVESVPGVGSTFSFSIPDGSA